MIQRFSLFALLLALVQISACQPQFPEAAPPMHGMYRADQAVLTGRVMAPGFATQATSAQVVANGFVALIDSDGVTQAGGTTNAAGSFTLFPVANSFTPVDGAFYTLRIARRFATGPVMSLQSTVKLVNPGWTSITGSTVVVNLTTTTITQIDAEDATVTPAQTMATVSGAGFNVVTALGAWSVPRIIGRVTALTATLTDNADPIGTQTVSYTGNYTITDATTRNNFSNFTAITGNLTLNAPALPSVTLPNLATIGGDLIVNNQANLTTLDLPSLRSVTGTLSLLNNVRLATLGLGSLTSVNTALTISGNTVLNSLAGFSGLISVPGTFTVSTNGQLPVAQANALRAQLTAPLPATTTISGNAP